MGEENNITENKDVEFKEVKPVTTFTVNSTKKTNKGGFGRNILVPFIFGVLGATIAIGICFKVPEIRNAILSAPNTTPSILNSNNPSSTPNTDLISLKEYSDTSVGVSSKVLPSVVGITVEFPVNSIFSRSTSTTTAEGSGIIISEDGYILTNNHIISSTGTSSYFYVVGDASKVIVYLHNDETPYEATIVGTDVQTDLAVIKIDKTGLTPVEIGDSDSVKVGEFAMAIGNPLGMQSSVSTGIISALNRQITTDGVTYTLIQTDAAINSGNSGGALVNSKGQLIGINTLKASGSSVEGMGFAIPINSAKPIYQQLIEYKKVKRPYIGIGGRDLTEELAKANNLPVGVYITEIQEFSAAEKAGMKIGDVIIEADGVSVKTMNELNEVKNKHQIGDTMKLKISRDGQEREVEITLQEQ